MIERILTLFCLFIFLSNVSGALPLDNKKGESIILTLQSSNLELDLGSIEKGSTIRKKIIILNKLREDLEITDIKTTCDCMGIKAKPQILRRNGILEIELTFDSTGIESSNQNIEELVYIITENKNYELIRFLITATIESKK